MHVPPPDFDALRRLLDVYQEAKDRGKIRYVGVSCKGVNSPETLDTAMRYLEDDRIDLLQVGYSYVQPSAEPLIAAAHAKGVGIVARSCMAGGLLTGRYKPGHVFTDPANNGRANIPETGSTGCCGSCEEIERAFLKPPYTSMAQLR